MPLLINRNAKSSRATKQDFEVEIIKETEKYFDNVMSYSEIDYIFLKSVIYVEEIIKDINLKLHLTSPNAGLEVHINQIKLLEEKGELAKKSVAYLEKIKKARNSIAHKLDYKLENDKQVMGILKINRTDDLETKKYKIAIYFKEVINGFLFIKLGMKHLENFILYKN